MSSGMLIEFFLYKKSSDCIFSTSDYSFSFVFFLSLCALVPFFTVSFFSSFYASICCSSSGSIIESFSSLFCPSYLALVLGKEGGLGTCENFFSKVVIMSFEATYFAINSESIDVWFLIVSFKILMSCCYLRIVSLRFLSLWSSKFVIFN
jgi:hypothetical protein